MIEFNTDSNQYHVQPDTISKYPTNYLDHLISRLTEFSRLNEFLTEYTIAWS